MPTLAIFDFDGTITTKDSFLEFIKYYKGRYKFYIGFILLSPMLILFKLGIIPNWRAKEITLSFFFKGEAMDHFKEKGAEFCQTHVPHFVRPQALETIKQYQKEGAKVVVVSASARSWIEAWCKAMDIGCISTELEVEKGLITGKIKGKNCYGPEKVNRIKTSFNLEEYGDLHVYGDSAGDREMLQLGTKVFYKPFRQ